MNRIVREDMNRIFADLSDTEKEKLRGATVVLTGSAGFLGYYFVRFFHSFADELGLTKVLATDNFKLGKPDWVRRIAASSQRVEFQYHDVTDASGNLIGVLPEPLFVIHMASIASPTFYRRYPIETIDANVNGLRRLLEQAKDSSHVRGFLFFSSSEVYGDPSPEHIPTNEEYRGNVASIGPRACYDEAKRIGETLCYNFHTQYEVPTRIARPFNNYGPGMKLDDGRVVADFAAAVLGNTDIVMFSDGKPTRTFCYISDAITGYLKILLHDDFDYFNIGIDKPEIEIARLAEIYRAAGSEVTGYTGTITKKISSDSAYLTDNPNRRCPDITKAGSMLDYSPRIVVESGVRRFLEFLHEEQTGGVQW